ncbi:MAG: hypothetical protein M0017_12060 [Desulfobacteraceae bacterium]|nr:hypothetical protein [Desulfobacteraceae bacterium]
MEPDRVMDGIFKELEAALKAMSKAKAAEEKAVYSQIVKNLCESLGVFLNVAGDMMGMGDFDEIEE